MKVAGFGFRKGVTEAALRDALDRAGGVAGVTLLATVDTKVGELARLSQSLALPVIGISRAELAGQSVLTQSPRVAQLFGTGSLAEAAALSAAGPGATLLGPRVQSADGTATAAIAERAST